MRYTRYDYKKKRGDNFIIWLIIIIVFSVVLGVGIYKIFLSDFSLENNKQITQNDNQNENNKDKQGAREFVLIQCGVFSKKDNADATLNSIPKEYPAYIIEDNDKYKLIAGIYNSEKSDEISNNLSAANINNFKIKCKINEESDSQKAEGELIDGYLKIINKLSEKDVKSIETSEFKSWSSDIMEKVEPKSDELNSIYSNINDLPEEFSKENVEKSIKFISAILINYKES